MAVASGKGEATPGGVPIISIGDGRRDVTPGGKVRAGPRSCYCPDGTTSGTQDVRFRSKGTDLLDSKLMIDPLKLVGGGIVVSGAETRFCAELPGAVGCRRRTTYASERAFGIRIVRSEIADGRPHGLQTTTHVQ